MRASTRRSVPDFVPIIAIVALTLLPLTAFAVTASGEPEGESRQPSSAISGGAGSGHPDAATAVAPDVMSGERLYREACATCHGIDGTGAPRSRVGFDEPLPDFTDCSFATREPDVDWGSVAHGGGPVRGFARMMPAFGDALTMEQIGAILDHVRGFCGDDGWPRGELNLPRPLVTEKAYPEDEAVWTITSAAEGTGAVSNEFVYERRFGARNQVELSVPFSFRERSRPATGPDDAGDWAAGVGDVAVGVKRALYHSLERGSIFSVAGEVILPTGDEADGFSKRTVVLEPFLAFGQILPAGGFLHVQAGLELPTDTDVATEEGFWRVALGKRFTRGRFGRTWSPMVELLGKRELAAGESAHWDLLPQLQVTLNTRQHVMANFGVRIPLDDADTRDTQLLFYLLWDWFDGGFLEGW